MFNFLKLTPGQTDFSEGNKSNFLTISFNNKIIGFEPSICYEAIFQSFNHNKSMLIINITNDAWFGNTTGPIQHLTASIFRSVEKGVPLVRSANSGISTITDANGKTLERIELNERGIIQRDILLRKNSTFFVEYGLLKGIIFFIPLFYLVSKKFNYKKNDSLVFLNISLLYFLIHNISNDLIYSPDAIIFFLVLLGLKDAIINQEDFQI